MCRVLQFFVFRNNEVEESLREYSDFFFSACGLFLGGGHWGNTQNGDVKLAKKFANAPPENQMELRKKLWKLIAEYVIQQKGDVKTSVFSICTRDPQTVLTLSIC